MDDPVTLSVITVTYNSRELLMRTMESIRNQTCREIEYIVVDGASGDGTATLLGENPDVVTRWISEPDKGIYDAMNKGLAMATGEYVWFINAGDEIHSPDTVERIFGSRTGADLYYGDTIIIDPEGGEIGLRRLRPPEKLTWKDFRQGQLVSHQAFIPRRELAPCYDPAFSHSADIDWQIRIMRRANTIVNTGEILCRFLHGGHSRKNIPASLKERFRIMTRNYGLLRTISGHLVIGIKFFAYLFRHGRF